MKHLFILLFTFIASISFGQEAESQYIKDYLVKWENSKDYLISIIKALPEDKLEYKPTEDSKSFRELTIHMVSNMVWLSTDYLEGGGFENDYKNRDLNKEELLDLVESAFKYSYEAVKSYDIAKLEEKQSFFSGPMSGHQILRLMNDHCSHHRGQLTLHLSMNNIAVPRYVGW